MVNFTINGRALTASKGTTILAAAEKAGIPIPHLCFLKDINEIAACRMCMVEVEGTERLVPACNTEILEGMVIQTNSPRVREASPSTTPTARCASAAATASSRSSPTT